MIVLESNGWVITKILGYHNEEIKLISQYIINKNVETQIVDLLNQVATKIPQEITNSLTVNKTWSELCGTSSYLTK